MAFSASKLHVVAIQSVVPTNPTDPRKSYRVHVHQNPSFITTILQRRFHALLCFNKATGGGRGEDSGWHAAGWIKESLGMALQEQPLLAGRLRAGDGGDVEIVSNDSGVRLVEAKADVKMDEFLELKEKAEAEAHLVFWEDVDDQYPHFSPLFYVQVTNFTCGGYSIGISCSLVLDDPFFLTSFIKRWADIHSRTVPTTDVPNLPCFYLPSLGKHSFYQALQMGSNGSKNSAQSVTFKTCTKTTNLENAKNLALLCIDKAEGEIGAKMATEFSVFVKGPWQDNAAKVEICSRQGVLESPNKIDGLDCERTLWDDELGMGSVCFNGGRKPAYASSWINSVADNQGCVMILPSTDGTKVIVTFT